MRRLIAILFMGLSLNFVAQGANFTVSLDRDPMKMGEQATLSLTFEGGEPNTPPEPVVAGLQFVKTGNSQNYTIINGAASSSLTITYSVIPQKTGEFIIPSLTSEIGGERVTSRPVHLTVLKDEAPSNDEINSGQEPAFMKLVLPTKEVYVGQALSAQLEIYIRDDVQNFGNLQLTSTPLDGFSLGKMAEGQKFREQVGNRVYTVVPVLIGLTALKTGMLSAGPFTANVVVVLPDRNQQNQDPFFRPFFNQGVQKQIALSTESLNVSSQALPDPKPANFNGAIGDFTMNISVGPTNLTVGDPLTVHLQIAGKGTLDSVVLPDQSALQDFKIFPPTVKTDFSDKLGLEGSKTFEEIVTPQNNDVHEWPKFSVAYFNPEDRQYHTLSQPAVPLIVHAAAAVPPPTLATSKSSPPENQVPQDILPIKENLGQLEPETVPWVLQTKFLEIQSLPVLAFLAAFVWRKRVDNLANNPRRRRQRMVTQLIRNGLTDLRSMAAENKSDDFFALLFRLLQEQLGERLDCPATAITEAVVDERLSQLSASSALQASLRELFQWCNQARYAPVHGTNELNSVVSRFEKTITELQALKAS